MREMLTNMPSWLWPLILFVPTSLVLGYAWREKTRYRTEARFPFSDLVLRPPGESTRLAAERFSERFSDLLGICLITAVFGGTFTAAASSASRPAVFIFSVLVVGGTTVICGPKALQALREYRKYTLGFAGERFVAEELNQLLAHGFHVFHDVPFSNFNIDHVVVGSNGLFCVETKTRRKRTDKNTTAPAHKVRFDGEKLLWASGKTTRNEVEQAARNARTLAEWLTQATGSRISCRPILTIPGWWIDGGGLSHAVIVAPTKKLHHLFISANHLGQPLATNVVDQITYQLRMKCQLSVPKT